MQMDTLPKDMQLQVLSELTYAELLDLLSLKSLRGNISEEVFKYKIRKNFPDYVFPSNREVYRMLITKMHVDILHFDGMFGKYMNITDEYIVISNKRIKVYDRHTYASINTFELGKVESQPIFLDDYLYFITGGQVTRLHIKTGTWIQTIVFNGIIDSLSLAHDKIYVTGSRIFEMDFDINIVGGRAYPDEEHMGRVMPMPYHDGYMNLQHDDNTLYIYDKDLKVIAQYQDDNMAGYGPYLHQDEYFIMTNDTIVNAFKIIDGKLVETSRLIIEDISYYLDWASWGDILITVRERTILFLTLKQGKLGYLMKMKDDSIEPSTIPPIVRDDTLYFMNFSGRKLCHIKLNKHLRELPSSEKYM